MKNYHALATGPEAIAHQLRRGSRDGYRQLAELPAAHVLGPDEREFLAQRDSLYLASIGETGWPYVQHRGGPRGFVQVVDPNHLAWAERSGNRQFLSAGNTDHDDRVSLIAVDYPNRRRLKLLGHARFDASPSADQLTALQIDGRIEGVMNIEVVAFDWNCPKYITPRYTEDEVRASVEPLHRRIAELERELALVRAG
jgi:predicted pyridoxine 5'-phosphate oxidase superfamily flavin-nucleotide-binding protein